MLEMRDQPSCGEPGDLVFVMPAEELADDLCARLQEPALLRLNIAEAIKQHYGARAVEGRLQVDSIVGEALLRYRPCKIPGGLVAEEIAWQVINREVFDLGVRPIRGPSPVDQYEGSGGVYGCFGRIAREARRMADPHHRPVYETLLAVVAAGYARDAVAMGLALRAVGLGRCS